MCFRLKRVGLVLDPLQWRQQAVNRAVVKKNYALGEQKSALPSHETSYAMLAFLSNSLKPLCNNDIMIMVE
jgi:hypothetical protein